MANLTLYRKYRPQSFSEIVNQEHVKLTIQQAIVSGKLPHAFLFYGPRGIGKTTTARVLAKSLNCKKRKETESEPCNSCDTCKAVIEGSSLSIVEIDAASQTGVDNVRENIIANARVAVKADEYKVFIIDEVHMLSTSSFNALLKTLEEPPERVIFVLATTEIHKIPETIISRCQRFDFHTIEAGILKEHLQNILQQEKRNVEDSVLSAVVKKSGGYARDAMSLLGQILTLEGDVTSEKASFILPVSNQEDVLSFIEFIVNKQVKEAIEFISQKRQEGFRAHVFAQDVIDFLHEMMLQTIGSHPDIFKGEISDTLLSRVDALTTSITPRQYLHILDVMIKRRQELRNLDQGTIPLELAVIELSAQASQQTPPITQPVTPVVPPPVQVQPKPVETPTKSITSPPSQPAQQEPLSSQVVEKKESEQVQDKPKVEVDPNNLASFSELQSQWGAIMQAISDNHHSVFIVLKTAQLRQGADGHPELAFKYQMHHDHVKRSLNTIIEQCHQFLNGASVIINIVLDSNLQAAPLGDVAEPEAEEQQAIGADLADLAEAFGGSVME